MKNKLLTFVAAFAASAGLYTLQAQEAGDVVVIDGIAYELGENIIPNGSFDNGVTGWTAGNGSELGSTFTVNPSGGVDNGAYLQSTGHTGQTGVSSIRTGWPIEAGELYYFAFSLKSHNSIAGTNEFLCTSLSMTLSGDETFRLIGNGNGNPAGAALAGNALNTTDGSWTKNEVTFTNTDNYAYLNCQFRWLGEGNAAGNLGFDNFYLCQLTPADEEIGLEAMLIKLDKVRANISDYMLSTEMQEFKGLSNELYTEFEGTYERIEDKPDVTVEDVQAEMDYLQSLVNKAKAGIVLYNELKALTVECTELLNSGYPGINEFQDACGVAQSIVDNTEESTYADYENGIKDLEAAKLAYHWSQKPTADKPADYTFLVQGPSFYNPKCGLAYEEFTEGNRGTWQDIEKWVNGSNPGTGDQYRTHYYGGKPCWNSWQLNFISMDIHQDLANLPNGYYGIKCVAMAQEGCINDQHAYVKSAGIAVSPTMTIDNAWNIPEGWEELTTEKVAVVDGKLTIGFASTHDATKITGAAVDGRNGWFCVTDFKLLYYGEVSEADYRTILNETVTKAQAMEVTLKGDRKPMEGALDIAAKATTTEQIIVALDTITASMEIINASNAVYNKFVQTNLATAKTNAESLTGNSKEIMDDIIAKTEAYVESNEATSTNLSTIYGAALTNYKTYVDVLPNAEAVIAAPPTGYFESTVVELQSIMADQKATLANNIAGKETIDWFITYMNKAISAVNASVYAQEAKAAGSNYDISGLIINPDASDGTNGWTINKGTGDGPVKNGQYYDGSDHSYFDSWNSAGGKLNLTGYQEINFLPNGTYTLKFIGRSSCTNDGAKAFVVTTNATTAEADTTFCTIKAGTWFNPETDLEEGAWDTRGDIWQEAYDQDPESELALVNNGQGRGWNRFEIANIQVTDHKLTIGMSTDSLVTHVPFTGTWFSIVDFQLTMNSYGADNDDNFGWVTGMDIPITDDLVPMVIKTNNRVISVTNAVTGETVKNYKVFTVTGSEVNPTVQQNTGMYVVKAGAQAQKVIIK